jgi:hypothetical protein
MLISTPTTFTSLGVELTPSKVRLVLLSINSKNFSILEKNTYSLTQNSKDVNELYIPNHTILFTGLPSQNCIMDSIDVPCISKNKLKKTLPYLIEPLLLHSLEEVELRYEFKNKTKKTTYWLSPKKTLKIFLKTLNKLNITPHECSTLPIALLTFSKEFFSNKSHLHIYHIENQVTCLVIKNNNIEHSFSWFIETTLSLTKKIDKLLKELSENEIVILNYISTGPQQQVISFKETSLTTLETQHLSKETLEYAAPLGYALLGKHKNKINFYKKPPHLKKYLKSYFLLFIIFFISLYFTLSWQSKKQEQILDEKWKTLLHNNKSTVDKKFSSLSNNEKTHWIQFLENKTLNIPNDFPLIPTTPSLKKTLNWLQEFSIFKTNPDQISLLHFDYVMKEYPNKEDIQAPYTSVLELKMKIENPALARKLRVDLSNNNTLVNLYEEVQWHYDGKTYNCSFYLQSL